MAEKMAFLTKTGLELFWNNVRRILVPVFYCDTEGDVETKEINVDSGFVVRNKTQMIVNFLYPNEVPFPKIAFKYTSQPDSPETSESSDHSTPSGSGSNEIEADDYPSTGENIEEYPQHDPNTNSDYEGDINGDVPEEEAGRFTLRSLRGPLLGGSENTDEEEDVPTEGYDASATATDTYGIDRPKAGYLSGFCHFVYYNNKWHLISSEAATMRTIYYTDINYPAPSVYSAKAGDIWLKRKEIVT